MRASGNVKRSFLLTDADYRFHLFNFVRIAFGLYWFNLRSLLYPYRTNLLLLL